MCNNVQYAKNMPSAKSMPSDILFYSNNKFKMSWQDDTMNALEMQSKFEQKKIYQRECEIFSVMMVYKLYNTTDRFPLCVV